MDLHPYPRAIKGLANRPNRDPWEVAYTQRGYPYRCWRPILPRLPDEILQTVVFLYPSGKHAERGDSLGGTGFYIGIRWEVNPRLFHVYVVTNRHVVQDFNSPVIRVNMADGGADIWDFTQDDWTVHPGGDDLAVASVVLTTPQKGVFFTVDNFLTQEDIDGYSIGIGDDVFSIGRFVDLPNQSHNTPVVRFGNVATMPPVVMGGQEVYLVEMRSRSGYSGSPVMLYIPPSTVRLSTGSITKKMVNTQMYGPWILGVQKGQIRAVGPELGPGDSQHTGMTAVVPIYKLTELLNMDKLVAQRRKDEEIYAPQVVLEGHGPVNLSEITGDQILTNMLNMPPDPRVGSVKKRATKRKPR